MYFLQDTLHLLGPYTPLESYTLVLFFVAGCVSNKFVSNKFVSIRV